jgi:sirohydrochlorin cobaltochelatase
MKSIIITKEGKMKKSILLVNYGCSTKEQFNKIIIDLVTILEKKYSDYNISYAFLSKFMRNKLLEKENIYVDLIDEKIQKLKQDSTTHIIIQPILVVPGSEFNKIENIALRESSIVNIKIGKTLLHNKEGFREVDILMKNYTSTTLDHNQSIVLMGHGSADSSQKMYIDYKEYIKNKNDKIYFGTLEAKPDIEDIIIDLQKDSINEVHLHPFLFGCGVHTIKDMLGENNNSWKSKLEQAGIKVIGHGKGISEYDTYIELMVDKINALVTDY